MVTAFSAQVIVACPLVAKIFSFPFFQKLYGLTFTFRSRIHFKPHLMCGVSQGLRSIFFPCDYPALFKKKLFFFSHQITLASFLKINLLIGGLFICISTTLQTTSNPQLWFCLTQALFKSHFFLVLSVPEGNGQPSIAETGKHRFYFLK